jgi:hypothetical protein
VAAGSRRRFAARLRNGVARLTGALRSALAGRRSTRPHDPYLSGDVESSEKTRGPKRAGCTSR